MAIYHLSAKVIKRSAGRSSVAAAAYRAGERIEDELTGKVHDYQGKAVDLARIFAPADAPAWVSSRALLWNQVERGERRKDAQLAREFELAIPRELSRQQGAQLVAGWVKDQLVSRGMVADVALHELRSHNPHAHVLCTMRSVGPSGFGPKAREWNSKDLLKGLRASWADAANRALERAGEQVRIDHRSNLERGISQAPGIHEGATARRLVSRGRWSDRIETNRSRKHARRVDRVSASAEHRTVRGRVTGPVRGMPARRFGEALAGPRGPQGVRGLAPLLPEVGGDIQHHQERPASTPRGVHPGRADWRPRPR